MKHSTRQGPKADKIGKIMKTVTIRDEFIKLGQALKLAGIASSGVDAKLMIEAEKVRVNGEVETRRGRKLRNGDTVETEGEAFMVQAPAEAD